MEASLLLMTEKKDVRRTETESCPGRADQLSGPILLPARGRTRDTCGRWRWLAAVEPRAFQKGNRPACRLRHAKLRGRAPRAQRPAPSLLFFLVQSTARVR